MYKFRVGYYTLKFYWLESVEQLLKMTVSEYVKKKLEKIKLQEEKENKFQRVKNIETLNNLFKDNNYPFDINFVLQKTDFNDKNEKDPCRLHINDIIKSAEKSYFMDEVDSFIKIKCKDYKLTLTKVKSTRVYKDIVSFPDNTFFQKVLCELNKKELEKRKEKVREELMERTKSV